MPSLILIHIGPEFPEYMNECIRQIQNVMTITIYVLVSRQHIEKVCSGTVCALEDIPVTHELTEFEKQSTHNRGFRNGFWKYTTMRFFYIHAFVQSKQLEDVFHIEYDNLVYHNFLSALSVFQEKDMWVVMDHPSRCIPSFMYFRNASILYSLVNHLLQYASSGKNDMETIAMFAQHHAGWLPIIWNYPVDTRFTEHAHRFHMLFDGACVGQYIGGVDPRNISGDTRGFINETCVFRCDQVTVVFDESHNPLLNDMPLVNLHVHSKDLKRWSTYKKE